MVHVLQRVTFSTKDNGHLLARQPAVAGPPGGFVELGGRRLRQPADLIYIKGTIKPHL
jgi:hypothetical protein